MEKTDGRADVVISQKEAYLLRNRQAHLGDYEAVQGQYMDTDMQNKHKAMLLNDTEKT